VPEEPVQPNVPNSFELFQNYPNPFNPTTTIKFKVWSLEFREPVHTTLKIYNIRGQLVRTLVDDERLPGYYQVFWDGKDNSGKEVSSGIYFYQLKTRDYSDTRKMILLR
jgi:flagellar hook assembly protein FlgD